MSQLTPQKPHINFAILRSAARLYLDIPLVTVFHSLYDVSAWVKRLSITEICPVAFVSVEFSNDHLTEGAKRFIQEYSIIPDRLLSSLREPFTAALKKLLRLDGERPVCNDTTELQFQILFVEGRGIVTEISHCRTVAEDIDWWSRTTGDIPTAVVGHFSIEVYEEMLLEKAHQLLSAINDGEPEEAEKLIGRAVTGAIGSN